MLNRRNKIQLAVFATIATTAVAFIFFGYAQLPNLLFGIGHYTVTAELPEAGGLYVRGNVTYRGTKVGQVQDVRLTESGAEAVLSLNSDFKIPSNLKAEVHSQTAIGEQYVALLPQDSTSRPLGDGDIIARERTSVPPDINALLDATNRGLDAIPGDNLQTAVDEAYIAVGGLGPDIARLVKGSTSLAIDARANVNDLTNVVDNIAPLLDTQTDTSDALQNWAAHLAAITKSVRNHDSALAGVLQQGGPAAEEARALVQRLQPTLPILLANLVSVGDVAVTYRDNLEQVLVLVPQGAQIMQAIGVPNRDTKQPYRGGFLSFNLNLNLPPPCTTGFLPATQIRPPNLVDYPPPPVGDLYCRIPQDSVFNVRGARNIPCVTRPGKRAPTAKLCESDEKYVPLNDGQNWKGDPNATLSGGAIPQLSPGTPATPPAAPAPASAPESLPIAVIAYDPSTGEYIGPDGRRYTQGNLAAGAGQHRTWQQMLIPAAAG